MEKGSEFFNYFHIHISNDTKVGTLYPVRKKGLNETFHYNNAEECKYKCKLTDCREHKAMTSTLVMEETYKCHGLQQSLKKLG